MGIETIIFYLFGAILIAASAMVVISREPIHSALFLILSFVTAAGIWVLLEAEFLAMALVIVYVGAVMVLFVFVVMMLQAEDLKPKQHASLTRPLAVVLGIAVIVEVAIMIMVGSVTDTPRIMKEGASAQAASLGMELFSDHLLAFEVGGVILFMAIIAAIGMIQREAVKTKRPEISDQLKVKKSDRLKIISMPAEEDEQ